MPAILGSIRSTNGSAIVSAAIGIAGSAKRNGEALAEGGGRMAAHCVRMSRRPSYAVRVIACAVLLVAAAVFCSEWYRLAQLNRWANTELNWAWNAYARRVTYGNDLAAAVKASPLPPVPLRVDWQSFASYAGAQHRFDVALVALVTNILQSPLTEDRVYGTIGSLVEADREYRVARLNYNDEARTFNALRDAYPTAVVAELLGTRYADKPLFAQPTSDTVAPGPLFAPTFLAWKYNVAGQHPPLTRDEIAQIRAMLARVKPCQRGVLRYAHLEGGSIALFFRPNFYGGERPHVLGGRNMYYNPEDNVEFPTPGDGFLTLSQEIERTDCSGSLNTE